MVSPAVHEPLCVAEVSDAEQVQTHLKQHERGATSYLEMSQGLADSGIERWRVDTAEETMAFLNRAGDVVVMAELA